MILNDNEIRERCLSGMISPFDEGGKRPGVISYGLSSFGYDMRLGRQFRIFTDARCAIVDPKAFDQNSFVEWEGDSCLIPPNSFALGVSVEEFHIPYDLISIVLGKSTYARCGIVVNCTPMEPGWRGFLTIEISNTTPLPAKVYAGEGIAQALFFKGNGPNRGYGQRSSTYQDQTGVTLPRVAE